MSTKKKINQKMQAWIDARKRHRLSHAQVQMARELGMNPAKLGKLDNHRQERWKIPLPDYIEELYYKRFGRQRPEVVLSIEPAVLIAASGCCSLYSSHNRPRVTPLRRFSSLCTS